MLKRIFSPSQVFRNFIVGLHLSLSRPQTGHILRVGEAIIVTEGRKTLSGMYRECVDAPDESAVADFFRQSPWSAEEIQRPMMEFAIAYLLSVAKEKGHEPIISAIIDDSTSRKDKDTKKLQGVDWVFDHAASGKGQTKYCKAGVHVNLRLQIGEYGFTFSWRVYLRESTVRRLNRNRSQEERIRFRSKNSLAREMLKGLGEYLPPEYTVYVLFDRWYSSVKLLKYIRRQGWQVIAAMKSNRQLDGIRLDTWAQRLRHNRDKSPKYFLCTDVSLTAQAILKWYGKRWSIEVEYWYLKQCLGLGDFRVQSYEAMLRWYAVVYLVLTFLQWRQYESHKSSTPCKSIAEVIRRHREEHAIRLLTHACEEAIRTGSVAGVIKRFVASKQAVSHSERLSA